MEESRPTNTAGRFKAGYGVCRGFRILLDKITTEDNDLIKNENCRL